MTLECVKNFLINRDKVPLSPYANNDVLCFYKTLPFNWASSVGVYTKCCKSEDALYPTVNWKTKRNRAMNLRDIVLNYLTDNEEGMQQLITWFLNDVMNEEVAQQAGVSRYARSSARRAHRNGYRQRSLKTRFGELSLQKPQLREIPFETKEFE